MKSIQTIWKTDRVWMGLGMLAVFLTMLPCILLGEDAIFTSLDQLDGEIIAYILQAKHLFQGDVLPEFMNGASKTALTVPAPLAVLLFLTGHYCGALTFMAVAGKLFGYAGMYLLARETTRERWIAALTGFVYSCIPFLAVYGLAEYGIPMLFWCALQIRSGKHLRISYLYILLYALSSSLVLVGFGVLGMGLGWVLWNLFSHRRTLSLDRKQLLRALMAWLLLLTVYVLENLRLLLELLGFRNPIVTHKTDYVFSARPFLEVFTENLLHGIQHADSKHILLLAGTLAAAAAGISWMLWQKRRNSSSDCSLYLQIRQLLGMLCLCLTCNLFFVLLSALWRSAPGLYLRSRLSFLGSFQLDRVLWIAPCLWYLAAACGLAVCYRLFRHHFRYLFCLLPVTALFGATALWSLYIGESKLNLQKLRLPDYGAVSYRDYYAIGVMEQIQDFLESYTGKSPSEYRVVSLGIDPAAALYHGFYCLDGYSNNYALDYKKQFRQVIAPELDKNDYIRQYFDDWGNRCYLFTSEYPGQYTMKKQEYTFRNYHIDTAALYQMGGRYLFAAAPIQDAGKQGLVLLKDTPFETADSYYEIYLYEISTF